MSDDPLEIQVSIKIKAPKGKRKLITQKLMQQAIERWAYTGQQSKWIEIRAIHWINPERRNPALAVWKVAIDRDVTSEEYQRLKIPGEVVSPDDPETARGTLHLESMSRGGFSAFIRVREIRDVAGPSRGKKNAPKRARKVSQVRHTKGKGRAKSPVSGRRQPKQKKKRARKNKGA